MRRAYVFLNEAGFISAYVLNCCPWRNRNRELKWVESVEGRVSFFFLKIPVFFDSDIM